VMATQNPIEQEGTYPLPEAQLDRFLMHVTVGYPDTAAEHEILKLVRSELVNPVAAQPPPLLTQMEIFAARKELAELFMAPAVERYIVELIAATRGDIDGLEYGASPRGTIGLDQCSRATAWLDGRNFVSPDDVQSVVHDVLRHRLILTFEAEARGLTSDTIIDTLLETVAVP
ncbi:MAG: MoxR family ATPase, partial [Gammaproteobacteria bacterium]|nr:MoxR family ATPase [Gammaproteobacteria bacterium]